MKIKLDYYLKRKRISLEGFLKINKLTSYKDLLEFCNVRNFIPVNIKEYEKISESKKKKPPESVNRKISETQKKKSNRPGRKSKPSTQKISSSTVKKQD